jgi:hypothetical protein
MRIGWDMRKVMQNLLLWKRLMTERIIKAEDGTVIQSLERVPCRRCRHHGRWLHRSIWPGPGVKAREGLVKSSIGLNA